MNELHLQAIYQAVAAIPEGKVATYGQVADLAGLPGRARMVGRVLSRLPKDTRLPWHRIINAAGRISFSPGSDGFERQQQRLLAEGVEMQGEKISLKRYRYTP